MGWPWQQYHTRYLDEKYNIVLNIVRNYYISIITVLI